MDMNNTLTAQEIIFIALNFTEFEVRLPFSVRLAKFAAECELTVSELKGVIRTAGALAEAGLEAR